MVREGASSRPQVALFFPSFRGGGAEGTNVRLANELARRGLRVDVVVLQGGGPWRGKVEVGVRQVDLRAHRALLGLQPLAAYLRRAQPSILMAGPSHLAAVSVLARLMSRSRTALMVLEHNDLRARMEHAATLGDRLTPWALRLTYPHADAMLAVSRGAADSLAAVLGAPPQRVRVLYNGLDLGQVTALAAEPANHRWLDTPGPPVVLAAGRLVAQKAYPDLIRAFACLIQALPARLIVLGHGPLQAELVTLTCDLGVGECVEFVGYQPNPYSYMARASVLVLASHYEGFGIVLLEALACGVPVVATDCPSGPREILADGEYGLLVPVGDPQALAESMRRLLTDPALAAKLREDGVKRAAEFSIERVADQFLTIAADLGVRLDPDGSPARQG